MPRTGTNGEPAVNAELARALIAMNPKWNNATVVTEQGRVLKGWERHRPDILITGDEGTPVERVRPRTESRRGNRGPPRQTGSQRARRDRRRGRGPVPGGSEARRHRARQGRATEVPDARLSGAAVSRVLLAGHARPVIGPRHRTVITRLFTRPPDSRKRKRSALAKRLRLSIPGSGRIGNVHARSLRRMVDSEHRKTVATSRMVSTSGRASRRTRASFSMPET